MRLREKAILKLGASRGYRRRTHETLIQDFDPDGSTSGHILCSCRPTGSRPGRWPTDSVPTRKQRLSINPATAVEPLTGGYRKVTKVTCRKCNLGRKLGLASFHLWAVGVIHNPASPAFLLPSQRPSLARISPAPSATPPHRK